MKNRRTCAPTGVGNIPIPQSGQPQAYIALSPVLDILFVDFLKKRFNVREREFSSAKTANRLEFEDCFIIGYLPKNFII